MNYKISILGVIVFLLSCGSVITSSAQSGLFPLQQDYIEASRSIYGNLDSMNHVSILPFDIRNTQLDDKYFYQDSAVYYSILKVKLLRDDLFKVNEKDFKLTVNPLFDFRYGLELSDTTEYSDTTNLFQNSRGFHIEGKIGKRFYFSTSFLENQANQVNWQRSFSDSTLVIPGAGRFKRYKDTGVDYAFSNGYISYYPIEQLNLFFGTSKMISGHGYRSHLLSQQSFNYPHVKLTTELLQGKLQVMWAIAALQSLERQPLGDVPESLFKRKAATFSSISYLLNKRVQVSIFESNIWRRYNEMTGSQAISGRAYVPIPLFGFATLSDENEQNRRIGANILIKVSGNTHLYSQYLNQTNGVQVGIRCNDVLVKGLRILAEYNQADAPEETDQLISFTHFNEGLGHPVLTEFNEVIGRVSYRHKRWNASVTHTMVDADFKRSTTHGIIGLLINPQTNLNLNLGYINRTQDNDLQHESSQIYIGLTTGVFDSLFDF